jgi:hypothetical protein
VGEVDLRTKFKAGQQTRYIFEQNSKNAVKSLDGTGGAAETVQEQQQSERIGLLLKVVESGDAGATIQVVYESIKLTLKTGDDTMEFDSTKVKPAPKTTTPAKTPATPGKPGTQAPTSGDPMDPLQQFADKDPLELIVGPMVGTTVTVKTDKNGAITSVSGGEGLGGGLGGLGGMAGGGLLPSPSQMANWLVAGMGGKSSARVGETWTNSDALSGTPVGAFTMKTQHTLKSASAGWANLAFTGRVEPPSESSQPGDTGMSAGQVKSASYTGTYVWDTRAGALAEMNTTMSVVLDGGLLGAKSRLSADTTVKVKRQQ